MTAPSLDVLALFMAHGRRRYGEGVTDRAAQGGPFSAEARTPAR